MSPPQGDVLFLPIIIASCSFTSWNLSHIVISHLSISYVSSTCSFLCLEHLWSKGGASFIFLSHCIVPGIEQELFLEKKLVKDMGSCGVFFPIIFSILKKHSYDIFRTTHILFLKWDHLMLNTLFYNLHSFLT